MGQEHTRPFTDAHACEDEAKLANFSHMVEAAAVGTPADLQAVLKQSLINFRLSRAAFQQLYRARWTAIQEELDQLIAVQQEHELRVLEMNFENGIRSGKLALGDTVLHIACRRNHVALVRLLLYQNAMEGVQNEEGQLPIDVTASDEVREEVSAASAMTSLLGRDFAERDKAKEMLKIARRVWPFWMFRGEFETAPLAACIFGVPSGARYHAEMQVLLDREAERYRAKAHEKGLEIARRLLRRADWDAARAGRAFLELSEAEKIQYAASLLSYNLHVDASVEELRARRGGDFVRFVDTAVPEWLLQAAESRRREQERERGTAPDRGGRAKEKRRQEAALAKPWRHRLCPPTIQISVICSSPDALRAHTGVQVTSASEAAALREEEARREAEAAEAEASMLRQA